MEKQKKLFSTTALPILTGIEQERYVFFSVTVCRVREDTSSSLKPFDSGYIAEILLEI